MSGLEYFDTRDGEVFPAGPASFRPRVGIKCAEMEDRGCMVQETIWRSCQIQAMNCDDEVLIKTFGEPFSSLRGHEVRKPGYEGTTFETRPDSRLGLLKPFRRTHGLRILEGAIVGNRDGSLIYGPKCLISSVLVALHNDARISYRNENWGSQVRDGEMRCLTVLRPIAIAKLSSLRRPKCTHTIDDLRSLGVS
jgi:hypothetical protein